MKALLIDPEAQTIEPIEIHGEADIVSISGNDKITSDQGTSIECWVRTARESSLVLMMKVTH